MNYATALWIVLPLAAIHACMRGRRALLVFQVVVDLMLVLLPGRLLLRGMHVGPGTPGGDSWGGAVQTAGSPEQTDLPLEFEPWWAEVRRLVGRGEPPWISDRIGGGAPLFANGQTGIPFPFQLPVWALGPERGTDVMAVWKLELAALGGFLLLRRFGVRSPAAAAGALSYAFGLYHLSWLVVPLAWVVTATPWALWLLIGTLRGRRRDAGALALMLGAVAGWSVHAESAAFLWLALAAAGVILGWGRVRRLRRLGPPAAAALLVAAVGALPVVATILGSAKWAAATRTPQYPDPAVSWLERGRVAAQTLVPWRDGHPGSGTWHRRFPSAAVSVGVGAAPIAMLALAALRRRHRRLGCALAIVGVGAASLVYQLPGVSQMAARVPVIGVMTWVRAGFLVGFSVACLSALALDAWLARPRRRRLVLAAVTVEAAALLLAFTGGPGSVRESAGALFAPAAVAALGALAPSAVPAAVVAECAVNGWNVLGGAHDVPRPPAITAELIGVGAGRGRVLGLADALPPNLAARWGLADLRSADPVRPLALGRLHRALGAEGMDLPGPVTTPWAGLAGAWGVRWLATPPEGIAGPAAAGWEEVYRDAHGRLYRNPRALPVLRLAVRSALPPGEAGSGGWEGIDFASTAVAAVPVTAGGEGSIAVTEERPWRHTADVRSRGATLAVLHVPRAPGWRVTLDGRPAELVEVDLGAMGVAVPPGEHRIRWQYGPPLLVPGAVLTGVGLLACLGLAVRSRRRPR